MILRGTSALLCAIGSTLLLLGCGARATDTGSDLRVRNTHELPYAGSLQFVTKLPDGEYAEWRSEGGEEAGKAGDVVSHGEVRSGIARLTVDIPAHSSVILSRTRELGDAPAAESGPLSLAAEGSRIDVRWGDKALASLDLALVVLPGRTATTDDVIPAFDPLEIRWKEQPGGVLHGTIERQGYRIEMSLVPDAGGSLTLRTRLVHMEDSPGRAYVALVRRVSVPDGIDSARIRFNGRVLDGASSPDTWSRDFWYSSGVDWLSWKTGELSMVAVNGYSPVPTIDRDSTWVQGSHFYVWGRTRRAGNQLYLISELSGPNPNQAKSGYMRVTPYATMPAGDTVDLSWRLAIGEQRPTRWEDSQLRVFSGFQSVHADSGVETVELGAPAVSFGTSYFPYSTFTENFDYFRTPGLDRETWWPFSPLMWSNWRAFVPRMQTDLHIIRAMGFEWVRLHHLELLQEMDTEQALAFLDFYIGEARKLGLHVLVDTQGPAEWVTLIASRYGDVVRRIEVENEVLIPGIGPGDAERWTTLYRAAKRANPDAQVFFTSAGNDGVFERLRTLGVPFDRVGLHAYKHGPEWKESLSSHALAAAAYARSRGRFVTLGEFNWKGLTRLSPEERRKEFAAVYEAMLAPRAIPELFQFQFHETFGVNPSIARRSGVRHYETISLDRRPKPEAYELMRLISEYARPDAPVRELSVTIPEARFVDGRATVPFTIVNRSGRTLSLHLTAMAFGALDTRVTSAAELSLQPGDSVRGAMALRLRPNAQYGTYHHFLEVAYDDKAAYGWGIVANPGAPRFEKNSPLEERVAYPQGADVVEKLDWSRPVAVAFGPKASALEMEMAYLVANTLQSATGRPVRLSSTADVPDSLMRTGDLILVGTSTSNPLVSSATPQRVHDKGVVLLRDRGAGSQWLLLTGSTPGAVQAAATDFVLRYWKSAKDSGFRITGMEKGAALGDTARITNPDPP
jgi:hypothetical protein